jgi:steroid delta-isomerase-like uncharacterized protein
MADNKELARRFTEAFNAHDEKALLALDTPDVTFSAPGGVTLRGREASTGYAMAWLNAFPDARMVIRNEIISGDTIVQEFTFEGTHTATLSAPTGDIPATNRRLSGRGAQIMKVRDGLVADTQLYFDQVDVLTQLGLMPSLAAAATR